MLSELAKTRIKRAVRIVCTIYGRERVSVFGPSKLLEGIELILDDERRDRTILQEVLANREESEKMIAGLLGMM